MIYTSLKNNIYYDSNLDVLDYKIVENGNVIYFGHSVKSPKTNVNRINIGEIIRDYLTNNLEEGWPALSGSSISQTEAYKKFSLISGELVMETYGVIFSWTDLFDGSDMVLSEPINSKYDPRMKMFWTRFGLDEANIDVEQGYLDFEIVISGSTEFDYEQQNRYLALIDCTDWGVVSASTDSDWMTIEKNETGLTITVNENEGVSGRTGSFYLCWPYFDFRPNCKHYEIAQDREHFEAVFSGNTLYEYTATAGSIYYSATTETEIISYPSWMTSITLVPNVGEENTGIINFTMNVNRQYGGRDGEIVIRRKNFVNGETASCEIKQKFEYSALYFTTKALANGTMMINRNYGQNSYQYRKNYGSWVSISTGTNFNVSKGDLIEWKMGPVSAQDQIIPQFTIVSSMSYDAFGNTMSLIYGESFTDKTSVPYRSLERFFGNSKIKDGSNIILPATTLAEGCYQQMFDGSTITKAPSILPAETMAESCYYLMFNNCTSLTTAPSLPSTNLVVSCYAGMFRGCTSLNYVKCMAENGINTDNLSNWLSGVSATGTFVKKRGVNWPSGTSGIPNGWTVQEADN